MTQSERNRNLSKSLPKRFGFSDLAIESLGSQEALGLIDLIPGIWCSKMCAAARFFGGAAEILVSNPSRPRLWSLLDERAFVALGSIQLKSALGRGGLS
ncbi:hypothetical protein [Mesorhizobium sp. M0587]|uniref:hypothetical protein n=1 Tax=Mesorhizobium sp. M0587 TaxID=2956964 RepID=UPI003337A389